MQNSYKKNERFLTLFLNATIKMHWLTTTKL